MLRQEKCFNISSKYIIQDKLMYIFPVSIFGYIRIMYVQNFHKKSFEIFDICEKGNIFMNIYS